MINFSQYLREAFDNPYPINLSHNKERLKIYEFNVENIKYKVIIHHFHKLKDMTVDFEANTRMHLTNDAKNSQRIFATVFNCIEKELKDNPDYSISFMGNNIEPSRIKLYTTMTKYGAI